MYRVHLTDLPASGLSRVFTGADHGDVAISAYFVTASEGSGPGPHTHPYDEIVIVQSGRSLWTVGGQEHEAGPGDVLVVKAGEVHAFRAVGDEPLVQLDLHLGPRFIQHDL